VAAFDRFFELRLKPIWSGTEVEGLLAMATDITERKEMERSRKEMERQLREAERMAAVGQMAAGVVHEMNSPLTAVSYYAQALARVKELEARDREMLAKIQESADRIQKLLTRVMTYAAARPLELGPVKLNAVIRQVIDAHSHELDKRPQARIRLELAKRLPPLAGSTEHLFDLVSNLLLNALQALPEGKGLVSITTRHDRERQQVVLEVQDDGLGIEPQDLKKVFTPFFTRRKTGEGMGLGLAIVKRIVALHQGEIQVESAPGSGARFLVRLPVLEK
jgi:signal transduction histidine kinase